MGVEFVLPQVGRELYAPAEDHTHALGSVNSYPPLFGSFNICVEVTELNSPHSDQQYKLLSSAHIDSSTPDCFSTLLMYTKKKKVQECCPEEHQQ